ncbi:MAG TPA: HAD family hydrolase [Candidatus Dormibacteraeota bacterium]|nr:HAD family hydrolase [Candidatus Dormibacteraeota bacterium]
MRIFRRGRPSRAVQSRLRGSETWAFDWDGTLLDSMARTLAVYEQLFAEFGVAFDEAAFREHYSPAWRQMYRRVGLAPEDWDAADRRWVELYETEVTGLVAGAADALRTLRSRGARLALVTSGHRQRVELELRANGLSDVFATAVYGDAVPHQKPDPAPLLLAGKYLRTEPAGLVFVGDAADDMQMARRAGAYAVGVLSGAADRKRLRSAGARWVAPSVVEVVAAAT